MNGLYVRDVGNLVRLHDVQTDTGNPGVGLVVDEQVLAIVTTVGHGNVRVVAVAVQVLLVTAQDFLTFVGNPPTRCGIHVEYRNTHQFTHGGHAKHTHLALVATTPETVVLIQLARGDVSLIAGFFRSRSPGLTGHDRGAQTGCTSDTGQRSRTHKATTAQTTFGNLRRVLGQIISFFHSIQLRYWLWRLLLLMTLPGPYGWLLGTTQFTCTTGISSGWPGAL